MNKILNLSLVSIALLLYSCTNGQNNTSNTNLGVTEFANKIKETAAAAVVDVRTPEEYASGHLANSKNIDWNGNDFETQISKLDKTKPVFVYCQSGRRSAAAASKMRDMGFVEVLELDGGISSWMQAQLPLLTN
jgi:thioredoxin 1